MGKNAFKEFVEVSRENLHKLPANVFVTDEADPEKAIPALIQAVQGGAIAAVWLHDYWAKEREMFRELEKRGPIDVLYLKHGKKEQKLTAQFNAVSKAQARKLKKRIRARQKTLEEIALRHFDPTFREYLIQGGEGKEFFSVKKDSGFHVDQSRYFSLSFIGAISGPGTWFVSQEDTGYYRGHYDNGPHDRGEMTRGYCSNESPVLFAVPEGAMLVMLSGDQAPNGGKALLHSTPFAYQDDAHQHNAGDKRIFERFTLSSPDYKSALRTKRPGK